MKYCECSILKTGLGPGGLFSGFRRDPYPFLLESSLNIDGMGRYSFFGSDPFLVLTYRKGKCSVSLKGKGETVNAQPLSVFRELLKEYSLKKPKGQYPFLCGAVGFFSYDFGFSLEEIKRKNKPDSAVPDLMFAFYDCVAGLDHFKNEVMVFSSGFPAQGHDRRARAKSRLKQVLGKIAKAAPDTGGMASGPPFLNRGDLLSNFSRKDYISAILKAKDYIAAGDIYQVNLSQMFKARTRIDDWVLYRRLLKNFPVAFSAFFSAGDFSIISASPERFLQFDGNTVTTRPMKGTRKRTPDPDANRRLRGELIKSKKEKAELLMIVDLERNDMGRVCDYGSIKVRQPRKIETYSNVFQATAEIQGVLHRSKDRLDMVRACFPGGSVTGCPKIRAMEIIEELEPDARSIYTGSLGYLSFHNTMELNVLIRSFLKKPGEIVFNVGGGIVTDSGPAAEFDETLIKAEALMEALTGV